jgi:hypothetical protein
MSEDRLERALEHMTGETVETATLEAVRARVLGNLTNAAGAGCAEFRADFGAYISGSLTGGRRVLLEDHISRCSPCRVALADMKGERRVIAMPQRSSSRWRRWGTMAAAAALMLAVVYNGRDTLDAWMAPGGPRATVVSTTGGLYRLTGGVIEPGAPVGEKEAIRTGPDSHAVLRLADGSVVDVNQRTELYVTAAWSGQAIHLQRGDVIVQAAKQRRGHLRVLTRDSIASVKGTVFAVSSGMPGSVVSVVEGSVEVKQPGRDVMLRPGQQAASNAALATSVADAIAWSPDADQYLQLLASFAKIEGQVQFSGPLRTSSTLLGYLPAGAFVYGAVPNLGGKIGDAISAAEQQAFENPAFRTWWNSDTGLQLRAMVDRVQSVSAMLGDEVVFSVAVAGAGDDVPIVMARAQADKRAALTNALDELFAQAGESSRPYVVNDDLMVVSNSPSHLAWAISHLGQGAASPFASAIAERYRHGAGWLMAIDATPVIQMASGDDAPPIKLADMAGVKYVFFEQRSPQGAEENEVTLMFGGARTGLASWLADSGSGGAAEYLSADALVAGYVSTREPGQLFQEFTALMTKQQPEFETNLATVEQKLGAGFVTNLTAAIGTEAAFALNGFSVAGPTWLMVGLANNPAVIDSSIAKLADAFNAELPADRQDKRIVVAQESVGGRVWHTVKAGELPMTVTWTYDGGYMLVASDRASAERAIATRYGGSALIWSAAFQSQLPASAAMHPSAFGWLNTKGALGIFSGLSPNPALTQLLSERDPVLVTFDGNPEQIHGASRTRLFGVIIDAMLVESVGRTLTGTQ